MQDRLGTQQQARTAGSVSCGCTADSRCYCDVAQCQCLVSRHVISQSNCSTRYVVKPSQIGGSCSCHLGMLHYLCKHVIKAVNVSSSKSVPENMMALGMWAGSTLGGFKQLENDLAA